MHFASRRTLCCERLVFFHSFQANSARIIKGKGDKSRMVYFGKRTAKALWRYLTPRLSSSKPGDPVFLSERDADLGQPLTRGALGQLLARVGERAGVANVYPHKFRHTFAITYLRNGGDVFTLQELLGHADWRWSNGTPGSPR